MSQKTEKGKLETKPIPPKKPRKKRESVKKTFDEDKVFEERTKNAPVKVGAVALMPNQHVSKQYANNPVVQYHFSFLNAHLENIGVDVQRHALVIILLAKLYAKEQVCEEELAKEGEGVFYTTEYKGNKMRREHPASKALESTRDRIAALLKGMGLMQDAKNSIVNLPKDDGTSGFDFISNL